MRKPKRKAKIGDKHGSLIVTDLIGLLPSKYKGDIGRNRFYIEITCQGRGSKECGKKIILPLSTWNEGKSSACKSCAHIENLKPHETRYKKMVRRAIDADLDCKLTLNQYVLLLEENPYCYYCEVPIKPNPYPTSGDSSYYVNRIDVEIGYIITNVKVCCPRCNKGPLTTFSHDEWYRLSKPLRQNHIVV